MIEKMCDNYPNLMVDISWVVWEDVICDESGKVKKGWVDCIQKHHTRFFIGSDNVAQFFPIRDTSINLLASNITKYYQLFDQLTPEAAVNVARGNAERLYFNDWQVPSGKGGALPFTSRSGEQSGRYSRVEPFYETECLDPGAGTFVTAGDIFDDGGKY